MQTDCRQVAGEVFCNVAERTVFMFGEPCDVEVLQFAESEPRLVQMSFNGPVCGRLELIVSQATCRQIAANFMGMEIDDEAIDQYCDDAVKELLNVTCGNILTELVGTEPVFDLTVPVLSSVGAAQVAQHLDDPKSVGVMIDDEPALLRLHVETTP